MRARGRVFHALRDARIYTAMPEASRRHRRPCAIDRARATDTATFIRIPFFQFFRWVYAN